MMRVETVKNFYKELMEMKNREFDQLFHEVESNEEKIFLLEVRNIILREKTNLYLEGMIDLKDESI